MTVAQRQTLTDLLVPIVAKTLGSGHGNTALLIAERLIDGPLAPVIEALGLVDRMLDGDIDLDVDFAAALDALDPAWLGAA